MTIGRNDLCFCGSGKKYKKCCVHQPVPILSNTTKNLPTKEPFDHQHNIVFQVIHIYRSKMIQLDGSPINTLTGQLFWEIYTDKQQQYIVKPEAYAGALHYLTITHTYCEIPLTQLQIAEIYNIEPSILSTTYRHMKEILHEDLIELENINKQFDQTHN